MRDTKRASFTARTFPRGELSLFSSFIKGLDPRTGVSNPDRSPSFRPSPSEPFQAGAFATGGPPGITGFNPYPGSSPALSRSQAWQYPRHALQFSAGFHRGLTRPATGALGPIIAATTWGAGITAYRGSATSTNRGGWHPSYPPLIRGAFYTPQKPMQSMGTPGPLVALSRIAKFSRLLRPLPNCELKNSQFVGPGLMSQSPSGGYHFHGPYPLSPWEAVTPPTS